MLRVRIRNVEYEAFPADRRAYYVPGVDASISFRAIPGGGMELEWLSAFRRSVVRRR
jgi:hypothetical protein